MKAPSESRNAARETFQQFEGPDLILDPAEREAFKHRELGIRGELQGSPFVQLQRGAWDEEAARRFDLRRSHRQHSQEPIGFAALSAWLGCLRQVRLEGGPKRRYGSAGSAYPVQVYLQVAPDRVEGAGPGTYYYHPVEHRLIPLSEQEGLDGAAHVPSNRVMAAQAAFWVFLVAELDAIRPLYGKKSRDFALIEAGLISQLLETTAAEHGLGLCQLGVVAADVLRPRLRLGESQELLHSLVGGAVRTDQPAARSEPPTPGVMPWNPDTPPALARTREAPRSEPPPVNTVAPAQVSAIQDRLIRIWKETLGTQSVDIHETFFDIGGSSLQAAQAMRRLQEQFPVKLEVADLFSHPTIAELSGLIAERLAPHAGAPVSPPSPLAPPSAVETLHEPSRSEPERAPALRVNTSSPVIAIVGMAGRFPDAPDCGAFWENLRAGVCSVGPVPRERLELVPEFQLRREREFRGSYVQGIELFDPLFFRLSPKEAARMDPVQRLLLQLCHELAERSGYMGGQLAGTRTAVVVGGGGSGYWELPRFDLRDNVDLSKVLSGNMSAILANRISHFLDLRGPSLTVDTACSSSLVAVELACRALMTGDAEMAIVAAANLILIPRANEALRQDGMEAVEGLCRTFDARADGYVRGEGAAALLLKPLEAALRDGDTIHALIRGSAINHDGRTNSLAVPNPSTQREVIELAHRRAGISPEQLSYVEAHGTGTPLGDPIELKGLTTAFGTTRRGFCGIGSVKTNLGHLEGAAGLAGMVKVILAMQNRELPPSLHFETPNPHIDFAESPFYVVDRPRPWGSDGPRLAAVSSFGFGGSNAHVVLEEGPRPAAAPAEERPAHVLALSARNAEGLRRLVSAFLDHLNRDAEADLRAICHSANTGRARRGYRLAVVARTRDELVSRLELFSLAPGGRELQGSLLFTGEPREGALPTAVRRRLSARAERLPRAAVRTLLSWCRGRAVDEVRALLGPAATGEPLQGGLEALGLGREGWIDLLAVLGELHAVGVDVGWSALEGERPPRRMPLPPSPLELQRCWWPTELLQRAPLTAAAMPRMEQAPSPEPVVVRTEGETARPAVRAVEPPAPPPPLAAKAPEPPVPPPAPAVVAEPPALPTAEVLPTRPNVSVAERVPATLEEVTALLVNGVSTALGITPEHVELKLPLFEMGMDSTQGVRLIRELEVRSGLQLQPTIFFENSTIQKLAETLVQQHRISLQSASPAPVASEPPRVEAPRPVALTPAPAPALASLVVSSAPERREPREIPPAGGRDIAIIGMSGRFPGASSLDEFWDNIRAGRCSVSEVPRERWDASSRYDPDPNAIGKICGKWGGFLSDVFGFEPLFFRISDREAEWMDPQQRLMMEVAWETLESAGYAGDALAGTPTGVYIGATYTHAKDQMGHVVQYLPDAHAGMGNQNAILANRISYFLNLRGPSFVVDTLCSSSLVVLHLAVDALRRGECQQALVGGVHVGLSSRYYEVLSRLRALSPRGLCRTFDRDADGYAPAEGLGMVLIKPLARALADRDNILGVIRGTAMNHGGQASGLAVPNPIAQAEVITAALRDAGVSGRSLSYVEAHGTGTALGDPIELTGLRRALNAETPDRQFCAIGSVKTNIGHPEPAAGIIGLIKVLLALRARELPPSLHVQAPTPKFEFEDGPCYIVDRVRAWTSSGVRRAGVSSFGLGGVNAHAVVDEAPIVARERPAEPRPVHLFVLSARTPQALRQLAQAHAAYLAKSQDDLRDVCFTAGVGRGHFRHRLACVVSSKEELRQRLLSAWDGASGGEVFLSPPGGGRTPPPERLVQLDASIRRLPERARVALGHWCKGAVADGRVSDWRVGEAPAPASLELTPDAWRELLETVAQLYVLGADVAWRGLDAGLARWRVPLPTYAFERRPYRAELTIEKERPVSEVVAPALPRGPAAAATVSHPLLQSAAIHENGATCFEFQLGFEH